MAATLALQFVGYVVVLIVLALFREPARVDDRDRGSGERPAGQG